MASLGKNWALRYAKQAKKFAWLAALIMVMGLAVILPPRSAVAATPLFEDDFSPQQPGWSFVSTAPGIMGELNNNENVSGITLSVTAPNSGPATLDFDLLAFRSLDDWTTCCTDTLTLTINGQEAFTGSFGVDDRFFTNPAGATFGPIHRLPPDDTTISRRISVPVTLNAGPNSIVWSYSPLQSFADEAWGLDNVALNVEAKYRLPFNGGPFSINLGPGCDGKDKTHTQPQSLEAIDYNLINQPVVATAAGEVIYANWFDPIHKNKKGFGQVVLVRHDDGRVSYYAHLSSFAVTKGAIVTQGQLLGISGDTGKVGPHLHFEIRENTIPRVPADGYRSDGTSIPISNLPGTNWTVPSDFCAGGSATYNP